MQIKESNPRSISGAILQHATVSREDTEISAGGYTDSMDHKEDISNPALKPKHRDENGMQAQTTDVRSVNDYDDEENNPSIHKSN